MDLREQFGDGKSKFRPGNNEDISPGISYIISGKNSPSFFADHVKDTPLKSIENEVISEQPEGLDEELDYVAEER